MSSAGRDARTHARSPVTMMTASSSTLDTEDLSRPAGADEVTATGTLDITFN